MDYISLPHSHTRLADGNVVVLKRYPGLKWVVHWGWYTYNNHQYKGWYFVSIPSQTILPVNEEDLIGIKVVSSKSNDCYPDYPDYPDCPIPPGPFPPEPGPCPPKPEQVKFTKQDKKELQSAFITVNTIADRNKLDTSKLPDGKIVRVNNVNGETQYYAWSARNDHWEDWDIAFMSDIVDTRPTWETI